MGSCGRSMKRATPTSWILSAELVSLLVSAAHAVARRMRYTQRYYQHKASQSPPIAIYPGARTRWPRRLAKRLVCTPSPIGLYYGRQSAHSILETRRRRSDPSVLMLQSEFTPLSMSSVREKRIRSPSGENSVARSPVRTITRATGVLSEPESLRLRGCAVYKDFGGVDCWSRGHGLNRIAFV
jgi:hypothetical protein